jgi:hypothetical protein
VEKQQENKTTLSGKSEKKQEKATTSSKIEVLSASGNDRFSQLAKGQSWRLPKKDDAKPEYVTGGW